MVDGTVRQAAVTRTEFFLDMDSWGSGPDSRIKQCHVFKKSDSRIWPTSLADESEGKTAGGRDSRAQWAVISKQELLQLMRRSWMREWWAADTHKEAEVRGLGSRR